MTVTVEGFPEVAALVVYEDPQPDEPARMTIVSGDAQSAPYGEALPAPLVAYVEDRFANPVWDQPVTWSSTTGGTVAPNPSRTDASGQTAVTATLGTSPDAPAQDFTATAGLVAVTFHAAAIGHRIAGIAPSRTWPECPVDITVEILGEHFDSDAAVVWNPGAAERTLAPTAVAADRIVATLTADLFVAAGVFPITVQQSAGGRCTPVDFVVGPVLPDTGQTSCYDDSAETACPPPGAAFYGQDAQFGWDLRVTSTQRFARSEPAAGEPVVLDRMTQLEWQGCTAALGGSDCTTGVVTARNWSGAVAYCEALTWGGHDDWRLPAIEELAGIVDAGTTTPSVDPTVFPAVPSDWFWSSTPYAESASYAWRVSFDTGRLNYRGTTFTGHVLCVRGGPWDRGRWESSTPSGDRVVFDTATGLLWQGCAAGQSGEACADGFASWPTWQEALAYCDGLSWGGYEDWRLPDRNELRSIIDYGRFSPAVDPAAFPATEISTFWTSSSSVADPTNAWYVDFYEGDLDSHLKTDMHHARCVRGAPWGL